MNIALFGFVCENPHVCQPKCGCEKKGILACTHAPSTGASLYESSIASRRVESWLVAVDFCGELSGGEGDCFDPAMCEFAGAGV